jgi:hypothetical protein
MTSISTRPEKIMVENVNHPGYVHPVDARYYRAMLAAMLKGLPDSPPGLTQSEMLSALLPHLPADLFPGGDKAGWWAKTVQLDQEAKGLIVREDSKPLRWHRRET